MIYNLLQQMKQTATIGSLSGKQFSGNIEELLSIKNLPKKDIPQGEYRHCFNLTASTDKVAKYISGTSTGNKLYPENGYLQWHTNSNNEGIRVYFVYVEEEGSWFRYVKNNQEITLKDNPGWNIRIFEINKRKPLWHCVYAKKPRFSFGFNCKKIISEFEEYKIE